jgi:hypothetical protein
VERIGRSISGRVDFFPRAVFFPTVQAKTGVTGFPNQSDRFHPVAVEKGLYIPRRFIQGILPDCPGKNRLDRFPKSV